MVGVSKMTPINGGTEMTDIYAMLADTEPMKRPDELTSADVVELATKAAAYAQMDLAAVNSPALHTITALVQKGHDLTCACRQVMRDWDCGCGQLEFECEADVD